MEQEKQISIGFWKHGNRLVSSWLRKGNIPKSCRLVLLKNKFYEKDGNRPYMIGYFVKTTDFKAEDIKHPYLVLSSYINAENEDEENENE